jgi:hypothetical protein
MITKSDEKMMELMEALREAKIPFMQLTHPIQKELEGRYDSIELIKELVSKIHLYVGETSIIYGEVSFNHYELLGGDFDCERFSTTEEVIDALKKNENLSV